MPRRPSYNRLVRWPPDRCRQGEACVKRRFESEDVLFTAFFAMLVAVTAVMGILAFRERPHPEDRTLRVLIPAAEDLLMSQEGFTREYEKLRPGIKVRPILFPYQNVWQKLEFTIVANIPPDVSNIEQPNVPRFVFLDALEPLDEWIRNDPEIDIDAVFPQCMNEGNWNGFQYALPTQVSTVCLWYNKTMLEKEGVAFPNRDWTLDDLVAAARKLTKDFDGDGTNDQWGFYAPPTWWNRYPAWLWMRGAELVSEDGRYITFEDPRVIEGVTWLSDLVLKLKVMPPSSYLTHYSYQNLFLTGKLAMTMQTRFFMHHFWAQKNQDKIVDFEVDISELPRDVTRATCFVEEQYIMPRTLPDSRKAMAWDYLKFLLSETGQRVVAEVNAPLAVRRDIAEEMVNHPGQPPENDRAFIDSIEYSRYFYRPLPAEAAFVQSMGELGAVYTGDVTPRDACRKITVETKRAVDNYLMLHPGVRLPVKTMWVPFDQRPVVAAEEDVFTESVD